MVVQGILSKEARQSWQKSEGEDCPDNQTNDGRNSFNGKMRRTRLVSQGHAFGLDATADPEQNHADGDARPESSGHGACGQL